MAINFFGAHVYGGGPAHVLRNPAPRSCSMAATLNLIVTCAAFGSIVYGTAVNTTPSGDEVPQYLFATSVIGCIAAVYFIRLAARRVASDMEWSISLFHIAVLCMLQYGTIIWGASLCYRVVHSQALVGTKMYYYFRFGRWLHNAILGISILNAYCIVYTSYVALVKIFVSLVKQRARKKHTT